MNWTYLEMFQGLAIAAVMVAGVWWFIRAASVVAGVL